MMDTGEKIRENFPKRVAFYSLFVVGTGILIIAVLFAQTPTNDHTLDAVLFATAGGALLTALILGNIGTAVLSRVWRCAADLCLAVELFVAVFGVLGSLRHLHAF